MTSCGPRDFQYAVVIKPTHCTSHHKARPLFQAFRVLAAFSWPTNNNSHETATLGSNGPPTGPNRPDDPGHLQGIDRLGEVLDVFGHLKLPMGRVFGFVLSVDGSEILRSPVEGTVAVAYPTINRVVIHPRWCRISEPSTVSVCLSASDFFFVNVQVFFSVMVVLSLCDLLVLYVKVLFSGIKDDGMDCHPFFASLF